MNSGGLPDGVTVRSLLAHADERGGLTEVFRSATGNAGSIAQFNVVESRSGALRGVRLDARRVEHLTVMGGRAIVGLIDCREGSPTFKASATVPLGSLDRSLAIPAGVAHGIWLPRGGTTLHGYDAEWSSTDEMRCRWDDPDVAISWHRHGDEHPARRLGGPLVSFADRTAGTFSDMLSCYHARVDQSESARAI